MDLRNENFASWNFLSLMLLEELQKDEYKGGKGLITSFNLWHIIKSIPRGDNRSRFTEPLFYIHFIPICYYSYSLPQWQHRPVSMMKTWTSGSRANCSRLQNVSCVEEREIILNHQSGSSEYQPTFLSSPTVGGQVILGLLLAVWWQIILQETLP